MHMLIQKMQLHSNKLHYILILDEILSVFNTHMHAYIVHTYVLLLIYSFIDDTYFLLHMYIFIHTIRACTYTCIHTYIDNYIYSYCTWKPHCKQIYSIILGSSPALDCCLRHSYVLNTQCHGTNSHHLIINLC